MVQNSQLNKTGGACGTTPVVQSFVSRYKNYRTRYKWDTRRTNWEEECALNVQGGGGERGHHVYSQLPRDVAGSRRFTPTTTVSLPAACFPVMPLIPSCSGYIEIMSHTNKGTRQAT